MQSGFSETVSYEGSDFEAIKEILSGYDVPENIVLEVVEEMWRRSDA